MLDIFRDFSPPFHGGVYYCSEGVKCLTFEEIIEDVMSDIDESMSDEDVLKKIKRFINRAYKELGKREGLEKVKTLQASEGKIKKPSDCIEIFNVKFENNPIQFWIEGNYIITNVGDAEVEISYTYLPEPLEELDDETVTNSANDEFILNYAKYLFFLIDDQDTLARTYKAEYENIPIVVTHKFNKIVSVYEVM